MRLNNKGFSLVEILGVVVILSILVSLGITGISRVISNSRKDSYLNSVRLQQKSIEELINQEEYYVYDDNTVYYFDYRLGNEDKANKSPYGDWLSAYVVVTYDGKNNHFYWTGIDSAGYTIDLQKEVKKLTRNDIYQVTSPRPISPGKDVESKDLIVSYDYNEEGNVESNTMGSTNDVTSEEATKCFQLKELSNGTYSIVGYNISCGLDVEIPSSVDGQKVTVIGENAFRNLGINKVVLYYGITEIENGAFQNNHISDLKLTSTIKTIGPYAFCTNWLTSLVIPEGVETIGVHAFASNRLKYVSLPSTLKTIGSYAFLSNQLEEIDLQSNATLGGGAFANNKMPPSEGIIYKFDPNTGKRDYSTIVAYAGLDKDISLPEMVNGIPLTTIADSAFANSYLNSVVIPPTVKTIGSGAFYANNLKSIVIPEGVTSIGSNAFRSNLLTNIVIPSTVTSIGNYAFVSNCMPEGEDLIYARNASGIDYSTIVSSSGGKNNKNCPGSTKLVIPAEKEGVKLKQINGNAFIYSNYKEFVLPDLSETDNLSVAVNAFKNNSVPTVADGMMYRISGGAYNYEILDSYAGPRTGAFVIPGEKNGVSLKAINASFSWGSYTSIEIPASVQYLPDKKVTGYITAKSAIFSKSNSNNVNLVKIINKTGKEFDWYYLTGSNHTNPGKFRVGTVSHQSGDIVITDS